MGKKKKKKINIFDGFQRTFMNGGKYRNIVGDVKDGGLQGTSKAKSVLNKHLCTCLCNSNLKSKDHELGVKTSDLRLQLMCIISAQN